MVLPLITPVGSNFIKDFPSDNTVNMDLIDAYAAPSLTSHPLQTYTPILTAVTANPFMGTAPVIRGFFYEIFDQIYTWGEFRFGATGSPTAGTGTWMMSLPFAAKSNVGINTIIGNTPVIGNALIWDDSSSTGRLPCTVHLRTNTQMMFGCQMNNSLSFREVNGTNPITWAPSDGISWSARYQRDPSV